MTLRLGLFRALFDSFILDFRVESPSPKTITVYTESAIQLEAPVGVNAGPD